MKGMSAHHRHHVPSILAAMITRTNDLSCKHDRGKILNDRGMCDDDKNTSRRGKPFSQRRVIVLSKQQQGDFNVMDVFKMISKGFNIISTIHCIATGRPASFSSHFLVVALVDQRFCECCDDYSLKHEQSPSLSLVGDRRA
jgi:hypothetical protein